MLSYCFSSLFAILAANSMVQLVAPGAFAALGSLVKSLVHPIFVHLGTRHGTNYRHKWYFEFAERVTAGAIMALSINLLFQKAIAESIFVFQLIVSLMLSRNSPQGQRDLGFDASRVVVCFFDPVFGFALV